jgi:hypothetical protein
MVIKRPGHEANHSPPYTIGLRMVELYLYSSIRLHGVVLNKLNPGIILPYILSSFGYSRKLHNEELHNLHSSPSVVTMIKSRRMRWAGHVARIGEKRNAYRILVGKPEGKRPLGRPRRRGVHLREIR